MTIESVAQSLPQTDSSHKLSSTIDNLNPLPAWDLTLEHRRGVGKQPEFTLSAIRSQVMGRQRVGMSCSLAGLYQHIIEGRRLLGDFVLKTCSRGKPSPTFLSPPCPLHHLDKDLRRKQELGLGTSSEAAV